MMTVNNKKSLKIKNRTVYFSPDKDKAYVRFGSPYTYQSRQIKIEGYETRLYWQYRYCDEHNGQTFFYTLTYNDGHMPHYELSSKKYINCFDYEDLRDLLTGGFRKQLLRKYGTTFKYFIGAELGDGKGSRGMHNNPHYHILFFLEPANNDRFPYVKITPEDFRYLVKKYWQGFDENRDGFKSYNEAKLGIAREGEHCGLVTDFRACQYVAKYVCKDAKLKQSEADVEKYSRFNHNKAYKKSNQSYKDFFTVINDMFNIPLNAKKTKWCYTTEELIRRLLPEDYFWYDEILPFVDLEQSLPVYSMDIIREQHLYEDYCKFCRDKVNEMVNEDIKVWRNRYCNKCRISHGVGDYALEFVNDKTNPTIQVPSKKGYKNRPISMYYYRKMFMDVVKDNRGSNLYVLNQYGIDYKVAHLDMQIKKLKQQASSNLNMVLSNPTLFNKMRESDINTEVFYEHSDFLKRYNYLLDDINNNKDIILQKYAEFKLVYEDRFFKISDERTHQFIGVPDIDLYGDYRKFLQPSYYLVSRNDLLLDSFLQNNSQDYLSYSQHPSFLRYIGIFNVLDMCSDYFFIQEDNKKQTEAEQRAATKRFHSERKLKEFYSTFSN